MLKIFLIFFKMGAVTFGGGYAMLPIIEKEMVETHKLITSDEYIDFISVAQSFPGPIAVNISVLIGYRLNKFPGSLVALLGVVMPSFLSILFVGYFYVKFRSSKAVAGFFKGVNAVVPALLLVSFSSVFKKLESKPLVIMLFLLTFIFVCLVGINPLWTIVIGGLTGLCLNYFKCI